VKQKIAITIDRHLLSFMDSQSQGNRSDYLNSLLNREHQRALQEEMIIALQEDLQDPQYLAEITEWDQLAADGINA
jgi:Arc/MetJ-type ribon-helix-helix transcriptional regulator